MGLHSFSKNCFVGFKLDLISILHSRKSNYYFSELKVYEFALQNTSIKLQHKCGFDILC
jgi:hypothetical protein